MNERIQQLKESTRPEIDWEARHYVELNNGEKEKWMDEWFEKFAELIVRECSRVIVNGGYWSGGPLGPKRQCTPPEIAQMIRQHFGVEE